jgi:thiamine biosynthesis lipoprotein
MATVTADPSREVHARAMGSDVHVLIVGGRDGLGAAARARIEQLEARWSRFRPASEISRLNAGAGRPVLVSADTLTAVDVAVQAWRETGGAFDPTVLPALVALGYDRDFATVPGHQIGAVPAPRPAPGCAGIEIDWTVGAVTLPAGTAVDLGGIGKGLAADLVVAELIAAGADGACVNLGGDLRTSGAAPTAAGWVVGVEHRPDLRIALSDGAVATSSSAKRRWSRDGAEVHHLVDPRYGQPAATGLTSVTVIAGSGARAEALTKAAFVAGAGRAAELVQQAGATGLLVADTGAVIPFAGIEAFLR